MDSASRVPGVSPATTAAAGPSPSSTSSPAAGPGAANRYSASASGRDTPPHHHQHHAASEGGPPPHGSEAHGEDVKRPRACEACRGLKVRCEMPDEGSCRRCTKAGRRCVVTARTRGGERQKKTDTRVTELEKKIDALAASLQARVGGAGASDIAPASSSAGGGGGGRGAQQQGVRKPRPGMTVDASILSPATQDANPMMKSLLSHWGVTNALVSESQSATAGRKRKLSEARDPQVDENAVSRPLTQRSVSLGDDYVDIVDRGLVSAETAEELFDRYTKLMMPHFPGIVFPPGETAAKVRAEKPLLFLSIMAAASSDLAALQKTLVKELMQIIAEKVVCNGEKTLELVQSLFISVSWYWPPESFEELKFYQLSHMGIVMCVDLGLGRSTAKAHRLSAPFCTNLNSTARTSKIDPESFESRRTWLAAYLLATNLSIGLRRPNLLQWSPFMGDSVEVLETSPDAAPTDKYLCQLVRANRLGEEVATKFSLDNPIMSVSLADTRTQLTLKGLERKLEKLKRDTPEALQQPSLLLGWGTIEVYMHEMSLHSDDFENMKASFPMTRLEDGLANMNVLTSAHLDAIVACFSAVTGMFDTFMAMEIDSLRALPVFSLVRVAYATVVMIKIYFTAAMPDSELGKFLPKESVRVEYHLDRIVSKFVAAAADDKCRPAAKFLVVLVMLRGWMNSRNGGADKEKRAAGSSDSRGRPEPRPASGLGRGDDTATTSRENQGATAGSSSRQAVPQPDHLSGGPSPTGLPAPPGLQMQQQQPQHMVGYRTESTANTPLQLLSEVAAGNSSMAGRASHLGWQNNRPGGGGGPAPQAFPFAPGGGAGLPPVDSAPGAVGMQWSEAASSMDYVLGDNVDWEGVALNFGVGMPSANEYEVMNMMAELNKPWTGESTVEGGIPMDQAVYYQ